jgi:putative PIN family toxin of toxin-antitoxin system
MKVVLDANVLVAAFAAQGLCHVVFELCLYQHQILLSDTILKETEKALVTKVKVPPALVKGIDRYLREHAQLVDAKRPYPRISRDPYDDHVLAVAAQAKADYLITGDNDLLVLKEHADTLIIRPRQFWEILRSKHGDLA